MTKQRTHYFSITPKINNDVILLYSIHTLSRMAKKKFSRRHNVYDLMTSHTYYYLDAKSSEKLAYYNKVRVQTNLPKKQNYERRKKIYWPKMSGE